MGGLSVERVSGQRIVKELGGFWKAGRGLCRCPAHDDRDPSLSVRDVGDRLLLFCFVGCTYPAIVDSLRALGLWPERDNDGFRAHRKIKRPIVVKHGLEPDEIANMQAARQIWEAADPIKNTPASLYLWSRGISVSRLPPTLRCAPALYNAEAKKSFPALVAAIQNSGGRVMAVQRIWVVDKLVTVGGVAPAKGTKAPLKVAKKTLGPMGNGAVRLGRPARSLGIAEGIETALSAQQHFHLPVWVSCGAWRMGSIAMPEIVERVVIFGDNGSEGEKAAQRAADAFAAQGYAVDIELPPAEFGDWNDLRAARPGRAA